jgi:hypothetical protein
VAIGQNEPALRVDDESGRLRRRVTTPEAIRSSVCAQFADRSMSSGGCESAGAGASAGIGAGTGAGEPTGDGGSGVESDGAAPTCVEIRTSDNQSELRDMLDTA